MLPGHSLPTAARRLAAPDAARLAAACGHVLIPSQPAAAGYRYIDLGADTAPFYVRRFGLGERTAAVCLRAPVECSSGGDAERGAAALAACEVTVGVRRIPWADLLHFRLERGESALLAQRAMDAVAALDTLEPGDCPLCAAA
jgi:hypothetical protein